MGCSDDRNGGGPSYALWVIALALVALNVTAVKGLSRINSTLTRANTFYLCVELWKLGGAANLCDEFRSTPHQDNHASESSK